MFDNKTNQIDEDDLEYLFAAKKPLHRNKYLSVIKYTILTLIIFVLIFVGINYQALFNNLDYWYIKDYKSGDNPTQNIGVTSNSNQKISIPSVVENHILIQKISVDAPISWNIKNDDYDVSKNLENGAIHLAGTALPGTIGNVFITAHSSNYVWARGNYKTLFSLLDKLVIGDEIYINYKSKTYYYKVNHIKVTNPNDLSVLNQDNDSILTLMTCTPVGTSLNRLIITSKQIYPNPTSNNPSNNQNTNSSLPNIR